MADAKKNVETLQDTLDILDKGFYKKGGKDVHLKLSDEERKEVMVFLPEDIEKIDESKKQKSIVLGRCGYKCINGDSFTVARENITDSSSEVGVRVLVLNLANPVNPGGGVRRGANAQEEDLCRKSSLLLSLETKEADKYYEYNRNLHTYMGSDAIIITPKVEIIKDEKGNLLDNTAVVSVMTCAAPMLTYGMEGMTQEEYEQMVYKRIIGMLKVAAFLDYKYLVLGAFGCGAFRNDASVVSDLFYKALKEFRYNGMREKDLFNRIYFAVLCCGGSHYNFDEFNRNFEDFYRDEDEALRQDVLERIKANEVHLDAIKGSMIGGAVGDALGYTIEFMREDEIFSRYGNGITRYELNRKSGKAVISDDTQMTLFTANGLLVGETRFRLRGTGADLYSYVQDSYLDWYYTQHNKYTPWEEDRLSVPRFHSWLMDVPELYQRRAPGNTCLSALAQIEDKYIDTTVSFDKPRNNSKGCGGIMRVAPYALFCGERFDPETAGQIAAITHGHSLGYMPAVALAYIVNRIVFGDPDKILKDIVLASIEMLEKEFAGDNHLKELTDIIDLAVSLSEEEGTDDLDCIHQLGEGWVAEETLGIALYCALKYQDDFSKAIITSVNHNGDSDSTGAVTGNILGALTGYDAIEEKWKTDLELKDVILELAVDLCHHCQMQEYSLYEDPDWERKYIYMKWKGQDRKKAGWGSLFNLKKE